MTPTEAQAVQDEAVRRGEWVMWFVSRENGRIIATGLRADGIGGTAIGLLAADTAEELRAMIPLGSCDGSVVA